MMIRQTRHIQPPQAGQPAGESGFTLIELILIIVILGVLALVAMPRFDSHSPRAAALSRKLVEDLRYAQNRAVATQIRHGIVLTATQYEIFEFDDAGNPTQLAKDPAGAELLVEMAGLYDGVALSTTLPNGAMYFEASGTPRASPTVKLTTAPNPVTNTIEVQAGGLCERVTIRVTTGLVSKATFQGVCP